MYYVLQYDVVDNFQEKRAPYRPEHLQLIRDAHARRELVLAGAMGDPPDGALLVFRATSARTAEEFARRDPYVLNGLVVGWHVRPWNLVVGASVDGETG